MSFSPATWPQLSSGPPSTLDTSANKLFSLRENPATFSRNLVRRGNSISHATTVQIRIKGEMQSSFPISLTLMPDYVTKIVSLNTQTVILSVLIFPIYKVTILQINIQRI